jgi:hypothetical protein
VAPSLSSLVFSSGVVLVDKNKPVEKLDLSKCKLVPADMNILATTLAEATPFSAAINEITISSTGSKQLSLAQADYDQARADASGPRTYTLSGLQGGADPNLNMSSLNLGSEDLQFLSTVFTSFTNFAAAIRLLNISANKCFGNYYGRHATPGQSDYSEDGWIAICDALKGTQIETLVLSDIGLTPVGLTIFSNAMSAIAAIRMVNLSANKCFGATNYGKEHDVDKDQTGWRAICQAFKGKTIETLVLSDIGAGPVAVSTLADAISDMASIRELNVLNNPGIDAEHNLDLLEQLCKMLIKIDPTRLQISGIGIGPDALKRLATLFTPGSEFTAATLNKMTLSSTGSTYSEYTPGTGPITYTLEGLQGGADPDLDLSSKNLSPADLQVVSVVFTAFPEFTAALSKVNLSGAFIEESDLVALRSAAPDVSFVH